MRNFQTEGNAEAEKQLKQTPTPSAEQDTCQRPPKELGSQHKYLLFHFCLGVWQDVCWLVCTPMRARNPDNMLSCQIMYVQ